MAKALRPKILVADDEPDVLQMVAAALKNAGFDVIKAEDGPGALEQARLSQPALIILDLMLPGMSGLEVCKVLQRGADTSRIPIVMLTARAEEVDRIVGLELGAEDYVTKPFSPRELVLRVQTILRRHAAPAAGDETTLACGDIVVDRSRCEARVKGRPIELTATEFKLLTTLIERRGRVQGRDALLNDVWGYENVIDTRTVDTHIRRLREKLGGAADCIETIRGFGYRVAASC